MSHFNVFPPSPISLSREDLLKFLDELLDEKTGIKLLSSPLRERIRQTVSQWNDRQLLGYLMRRLRRAPILDQHLPPSDADIDNDLEVVAGPIGQEEAEIMFAQLLDEACVIPDELPVKKASILVELWAVPLIPEYPSRTQHWWLILATANCLSNFGNGTAACTMIEADLMPEGAALEIYNSDKIIEWYLWMRCQDFTRNLDSDKLWNLIATLAHTTSNSKERRPEHGLLLLERLFGLDQRSYDSVQALSDAISKSIPYHLLEGNAITSNTFITCITRLSRKLLQVVGRDAWQAKMILDAVKLTKLNFHESIVESDNARELEVEQIDSLFTEEIGILAHLPEGESIERLEQLLKITPSDYDSYSNIKAKMDAWLSGYNGNLDSVSILIDSFGGCLIRSGPLGSFKADLVLRAFLDLSPSLPIFNSHAMCRAFLDTSRLVRLTISFQAGLIANWARYLLSANNKAIAADALLLIEAWLHIEPSDYEVFLTDKGPLFDTSNRSLRVCLRGNPSLPKITPLNCISVFRVLVECLMASSMYSRDMAGMYRGSQVVEFLAHPMEVEAPLVAPTPKALLSNPWISQSHPYDIVQLMNCWISGIGQVLGSLGIDGANSLVEYIRFVRDQQLPTHRHRADFLREIKTTQVNLREIGSLWLESGGLSSSESDRLEVMMLGWLEELENRLLVERIRSFVPTTTATGNAVQTKEWPFCTTHDSTHIEFMNQYLPPNAGFSCDMSLCDVLGIDCDTLPVTEIGYDPNSLAAPIETNYQPWGHTLNPNTIVFRFIFKEDGTLKWWAYLGTSGEPVRVAAGQSRPDAERRLERAVHEFDLSVDLAWFRCKPELRTNKVNRAIGTVSDALNGRLNDGFSDAVEVLRKAKLNTLAELLRLWNANQGNDPQLTDQLRSAVASARVEPINPVDEQARRSDLDLALDKLVVALEAEVSLEAVWSDGRDWKNMDVIVQPQGPLWAVPFGWLSFGGKPLFTQVASIGYVVSLSSVKHGDPSNFSESLISAQWLKPPRSSLDGLTLLHTGLQKVSAKHRLQIHGLAEDPTATVESLIGALTKMSPRIVVVGGHGIKSASGVKLQDKPWAGGGVSLDQVDLLILVACAVGRVGESAERDVTGLYAELAAHGARSVIAARWPIADREAATFVTEIVEQYLLAVEAGEPNPRSRALARARQKLVNAALPYGVSRHLAAAFEVYGAG